MAELYEVEFRGHELVCADTMAFRFEKPVGFEFRPGQYVDLTLVDPPETDDSGDTRTFSLACAPFEEELVVATRMRDSAFKRVLKEMAPGSVVELNGPHGEFVLPDDSSRPLVFLAGGIGITPFLSMLRQAAHDGLPHRIHLFYSNRRPEVAAYLDELKALEKRNPHFTLVATMTEMGDAAGSWPGETRFIDPDLIARHAGDLAAPAFYVAGPPAMVSALWERLTGAGVDPKRILAEEFPGY